MSKLPKLSGQVACGFARPDPLWRQCHAMYFRFFVDDVIPAHNGRTHTGDGNGAYAMFRQGSKKVKVAHTRLPSVWFRSWSRFLAVSLQVTWVINQAVGCHYFPPGLQLPPQPLRGLLAISLLGEQRHVGCEHFAYDCYPIALRLRFEPRPFCAWVQHANHSATEPPNRAAPGAKYDVYDCLVWSTVLPTVCHNVIRH